MADAELESIIKDVKRGIVEAMQELDLPSRVIFAELAEEYVYKPYDEIRETWEYQRRGAGPGGIKNPDTYETKVDAAQLTMTIMSNLTGNPEYEPPRHRSEGWDQGNITEIIEEGTGYHWRGSTIYKREPFPRPWMEKSGDKFVDELLIPSIDIKMKHILGG